MVCRVAIFAFEGIESLRDAAGALLLSDAAKERLTARGYTRVLKVARTLADLDGADGIRRVHLAKTLSYQRRPGAETSQPGAAAPAR